MHISTTSPVDLLKQLIAIPSVNPMGQSVSGDIYYETAVTRWLVGLFEERKIPYRVQEVSPGRANVVAVCHAPGATKTVMLDAHQDTVPVEGMTIPPFEPTEKEGRIYGRGACDVKGGMAAMLSAFLRLTESEATLPNHVLLSCSCDEEATLGGIQRLADEWSNANDSQSEPESLLHRSPDLAIIAEPTELDVINAHKGVVRWKINVAGRACHSSAPREGESAIYRMGHILRLLEEYAEQLESERKAHPRLGSATISVGIIKGGSSVNIVPEHCEIEIDRRLIPGEEGLAAQAELHQFLSSHVDFEIIFSEPWVNVPPLSDTENGLLSKVLLQTIEPVAGERTSIAVPFGTHASPVAAAGVPAVVFGPGSIDQAHTKDEWIEVKQLEQAAEIYYQFCLAELK
ncbi:Acetylornithine deacetylase [Polystyrenella longa]|uniref:Probable succinyl-diaminopimelate desuccinylase n=1 Tax=Polystyrenella longa TaxID=2528007 RepID=A0A518CH18_9PLAN|nr:M20 family metallopeptidase [Polystyrenella longa]QDU78518.1 Acetylornithine deacetylase [Polystyrenella longa]